ncbi:tail fiber protein [Paenibacillus humicus]|uniref:tail fiber protein n=1 Tax=Paenibacillus humicus TaxID=412861 RepID=UPI003D2A1FFF
MAKTDWSLNDTVQPQDMNAIGEEINQLREDVDHIEIPPASVTEAGIVKLSSTTNSTSETLAATPRAVKSAYDAATAAQTTANAANTAAATAQSRADSAFQLGNERKAEVVAALVAKGISASTSESWDSLITKLNSIVKATGNASAAQLLNGYTASNANGSITGGMPDRGAVTSTITMQGGQYTIPAGYHNGTGKITASFANLIAGNVRKDINIGGILGTLEQGNYLPMNYLDTSEVGATVVKDIYSFPAGLSKLMFITEAEGAGFASRVGVGSYSGYQKNIVSLISDKTGAYPILNILTANKGLESLLALYLDFIAGKIVKIYIGENSSYASISSYTYPTSLYDSTVPLKIRNTRENGLASSMAYQTKLVGYWLYI